MRRRLPPALQLRDFALLWTSSLANGVASQMIAVAIGWQVYAVHRNPLDLGLVGLAEFVPLPLLALPAGQVADRVSRKAVTAVSMVLTLAMVGVLLAITIAGAHAIWPFLVVGAIAGVASAVGSPATRALTPEIVPAELLAGAVALRSVASQIGIVTGPAIGGIIFAVLLGDSIALAPVFARTILDVGPIGLGALRAAPSVGALAAGLMLARRPLKRRAGRTLLGVIATFGAAMIVFGLSKSLPLSLAALAVSGFVDMISVNIRATTLALVTPMELQGRVNAVEWVFIGASNELGAFESGAVASLIGTVGAVVAGGAAMIGIAATWPRLFPALSRLGRLDELRPATAE